MSALTVSKEHQGGALVVTVAGELDISTVPQLVQEVEGLTDGARLLLDLTDLEFVDSTGLRTLVVTARSAAAGCTFVCPPDNAPIQRMLDFFGVPDAYPVHGSRAEAGVA